MKGAKMRVPTRGKTAAARSSSSRFSQPARPFSTPPVEERTLADLDAWMESAGRLGQNVSHLSASPTAAAGGVVQRMPKKHHDPMKKKHLTKGIAAKQIARAAAEQRGKAEDARIARERREAAAASKKAAKKAL